MINKGHDTQAEIAIVYQYFLTKTSNAIENSNKSFQ